MSDNPVNVNNLAEYQPCDTILKGRPCKSCHYEREIHPGGEKTFIGRCVHGMEKVENIDNWVSKWQDKGGYMGSWCHLNYTTIRTYLGMTKAQFKRWMQEGDGVLGDILKEYTS
jgi:hypothetical protein